MLKITSEIFAIIVLLTYLCTLISLAGRCIGQKNNLINIKMKEETKKCPGYFHPAMKVVTFGTRTVLCQSGLEDYVKGDDINFES